MTFNKLINLIYEKTEIPSVLYYGISSYEEEILRNNIINISPDKESIVLYYTPEAAAAAMPFQGTAFNEIIIFEIKLEDLQKENIKQVNHNNIIYGGPIIKFKELFRYFP